MRKHSATWALALSLATGIAGAVSVSEARTVFDASAALRAAADSAANPYTDAQSATWTVYRRAMANDGTTVPLAGQAVVTATPTAKGIGSYDDWCFVVGTAETQEKAIDGLGSKPVRPGDLVFHPANTTRVALRFTPPRNGRYSFSAQFYTINPGANGAVDVTVMLNGAVLMQEEVRHDNGQGAASSLCAHENVFLTTGDNLEFVVGAGFDNKNGADSTALTLSIVEEGKESFGSLARYDATDAVATMLADGGFVSPCTTQGATWSLKGSTWNSWRLDDTVSWSDYYAVDGCSMEGPLPEPWAAGCPTVARTDDEWCRLAVNQSGGPVQLGIGRVGVNELLVHTGASHYPTIRFAVPTRGTYLVTAVVRHLSRSDAHDGLSRDGIVLGLMAGGDPIACANVNCQNGENPIALVQAQTPILDADETIDCQIHCGVNNNSDASALRLTLVRLEDAAWKGLDIGRAVTEQFKDKKVTTESFVDGNGGTWSTGWMTLGSNVLNAFPQTGSLNDGNLQGVTYDGDSSWVYLLANMTGAPLPGWFNTTYFPERSYVQMREIVFHPGADKDPVLRVQVPNRGYYNITFHVRDIQPMAQFQGAVAMKLMKNGKEELSGCWAGWWTDGGCYETSVRLKDIYLRPSDRLDFRLNCNDNTGGDLTALRGWIVPSGKADDVPVPGFSVIVR